MLRTEQNARTFRRPLVLGSRWPSRPAGRADDDFAVRNIAGIVSTRTQTTRLTSLLASKFGALPVQLPRSSIRSRRRAIRAKLPRVPAPAPALGRRRP